MQSQHPMWRLGCFGHFGLAIKLQSTDNFGYQLGTRIIWRWNLRLVLSIQLWFWPKRILGLNSEPVMVMQRGLGDLFSVVVSPTIMCWGDLGIRQCPMLWSKTLLQIGKLDTVETEPHGRFYIFCMVDEFLRIFLLSGNSEPISVGNHGSNAFMIIRGIARC